MAGTSTGQDKVLKPPLLVPTLVVGGGQVALPATVHHSSVPPPLVGSVPPKVEVEVVDVTK